MTDIVHESIYCFFFDVMNNLSIKGFHLKIRVFKETEYICLKIYNDLKPTSNMYIFVLFLNDKDKNKRERNVIFIRYN